VHPAAEIPIRLGRSVVPLRVIEAVWGFCVVYIVLFGAMLLVLVATGLDQVTAFSALASSINNMGPGLGLVVADFTQIGATAKWICILAMLLGRLEVFTLLVLFSPSFWRS
jgi:trk system potassium uptake protein TrkH